MSLNRRAALSRSLAAAAGAFLAARPARSAEPARFTSDPFKLGVAAGDPRSDGFVIWTRLAPEPFQADGGLAGRTIAVDWSVAADPEFRAVVRSGRAAAHPDRAHAIHVELAGLLPDRPYWYRFDAGGARSRTGQARTLPAPGSARDRFRLAWASCQHFEQGWFTPYQDMVAWGPELILHLGDYIYESSWGPQVRRHPYGEPKSLGEYRVHHALYKLDADLQAAHAAACWAFIWDDHDVENDYAGVTPEDPAEAEAFPARRAAAYRAWLENLPVSPRSLLAGGAVRMHRELMVGDLMQLLLLDARQHRSPRACVDPERWRSTLKACPEAAAAARTILGPEQEAWFADRFAGSAARWTAIAQPTLFSHWHQLDAAGQPLAYQDGWAAYPAARQRLLDQIATRGRQDVVIVGGDMHSFFANDVKSDFGRLDSPVVAAEFVTSSITSHSFNFERWRPSMAAPENAHLRFFDDRQRGWCAAVVGRDRWEVDFRAASSVWRRDPTFASLRRWTVEHGRAGVQPA